MTWPPPRDQRRSVTYDDVVYAPGSQFRVVREGARLSGWQPMGIGNAQRGWARDLHVGDVIVCAGFGPGWGSDPGFGIEFTDPERGLVEFWPVTGGVFAYRPAPGYLVPVNEGAPDA